MKILIVNYFYPPVIDAHSYRWEQIAKYWAGNGHDVEVITGRVQGLPRCNLESGVHVTRVGMLSKSIRTSSHTHRSLSPLIGLRSGLIKILRSLYRKLYWPDSAWHWIPSVVHEIIGRRHNNYDLAVSYYPCFAAHIAVAALKLLSERPQFAWIADYGDPFSVSRTIQPNNYSLYAHLNILAERKFVRGARALVFTNEATADAYRVKLGLSKLVKVIPHLVNINSYYAGTRVLSKENAERTALYYIGGFHRGIREPHRLFDLIRQLNTTQKGKYILKLYGPQNGFDLSELSPADCQEIVYMGPIERDRAIELLKNADIIVNVDNENCIQTPSKIVECIGTGRPIINIASEEAYYPPLQDYCSLGYSISLTERHISNNSVVAVAQFINNHRTQEAAPLDIVEKLLRKHSLEIVSDQYLSLLTKNPFQNES